MTEWGGVGYHLIRGGDQLTRLVMALTRLIKADGAKADGIGQPRLMASASLG